MTNIQNYKSDSDFEIRKGFNKIVKDIRETYMTMGRHANQKWDIYKVIDLQDGSQVLYFGGGHDDMGIGTFIFKNNAKTRSAFTALKKTGRVASMLKIDKAMKILIMLLQM